MALLGVIGLYKAQVLKCVFDVDEVNRRSLNHTLIVKQARLSSQGTRQTCKQVKY